MLIQFNAIFMLLSIFCKFIFFKNTVVLAFCQIQSDKISIEENILSIMSFENLYRSSDSYKSMKFIIV